LAGAWIGQGVVNVTTSGTPVQLTTTKTLCMVLFIQAKHGNTGRIVGGNDNTVRADLSAGSPGFIIGAPTSSTATPPSVTMSHSSKPFVFDASGIWIDATASGDGVIWSIVAP